MRHPADEPSLYGGAAGVAIGLLEGYLALGEERYAAAAAHNLPALEDEGWGLHFGLTGIALAYHLVGSHLGDAGLVRSASAALDRVRAAFDGERWGPLIELMVGNAGIALGALQMGDLDLAVRAVEPLRHLAEPTPAGVIWAHRSDAGGARVHHISHGTLGISYALAAVGHAAGRSDLVELALAGAAEIVARDEADPDGFLVPHSDPPWRPDINPRYSYGWCHGPAGDAQVFRLLAAVTGDPAWTGLITRCWHTVTSSGLPQRLRPGFWDNNGRCCGTAGVLALASDLGDLSFGQVLADDLARRATRTDDGVCWSNFEHTATPGDLPPSPGWAMGNAGIARELLRFDRLRAGGHPDYYVTWPDQLPLGG